MRHEKIRPRTFVVGTIVLLLVCLLVPAGFVSAADVEWPEFERIDGKIEGFPLPLVQGPHINGGRIAGKDQHHMSLYCRYSDYDGEDDYDYDGIELTISYYPNPSVLTGGSLTSSFNDSKTRFDIKIELREDRLTREDNCHEMEWVNTDGYLSYVFQDHCNSYNNWRGLRAGVYRDHYTYSVKGYGEGSWKDAEILAEFDIAEQYAKDSIDMLEGGLTLKHYDPLTYLMAGGGYDHRPAGDLIATLTGKDGKPVKNETVVFYVEPGSTLEEVMISGTGASWLATDILGAGVDPVVLGADVTDREGEAYLNYLWPNLIDAEAFIRVMKVQRYTYLDEGKISGKIYAVTIDQDEMKVVQKTSVDVEFVALAKIVRITGEGRTDEFKEAYIKEYPDSPTWGPGQVRVKGPICLPHFDYTPVEAGFLLMPGNIIDIDGGVEVEIVWVTGDRAIARVPDKIKYKDTEVRPSHSRLVLSTSSYDSGFHSTWDKVKTGIFGFSLGKGLDVLASVHPVAIGVKEGGKLSVSVYNAVKEADYTNQNLMIKIRLRSIVSIDTTGEETVIQTFEGSPDVLTRTGGETTLGEGEMVTVATDGTLGETNTFNAKSDAGEWSATVTEWEAAAETLLEGSVSDGGDSSIPVGAIIGIVVGAVVGVIFVRRKRKA